VDVVAVASTYLDALVSRDAESDAGNAVCKIGERFRVYDGVLVEIEVVYSTELSP
jgi:hypothetical protein